MLLLHIIDKQELVNYKIVKYVNQLLMFVRLSPNGSYLSYYLSGEIGTQCRGCSIFVVKLVSIPFNSSAIDSPAWVLRS